ncbi:MAG: AraC family transcriptional regulator [Treponema sp.]|nr:AraC family transcriptional regulator [Treponema sp.]
MAEHYSDQLTVREMAERLNLNPVYFGALFKKETGVTMNQYLIQTRMRNAENMLRSGEYKIKKAAERCGYTDMYYFRKQFKAQIGIPPSQCIPKRQQMHVTI